MRAAMHDENDDLLSQNEAVERFGEAFDDELLKSDLDPALLVREFFGDEFERRARELYRTIYQEYQREERRGPSRLTGRPRRTGETMPPEPMPPEDTPLPAVPPGRPSAVARVMRTLWLDVVLINGQPLRYTAVTEAREYKVAQGRHLHFIELCLEGLPDHGVVGDYISDDDAERFHAMAEAA
jgi:hypothetical protein